MIVMKFGGTSLENADCIRKVRSIVESRSDKRPVIVVSAIAGTTDELLAAGTRILSGKTTPEEALETLRAKHLRVIGGLELDETLLDPEFADLERVMRGVHLLGELSKRSLDQLASFGERFSCKIVSAYLNRTGMNTKPYTGWEAGLVTDDKHTCAEVLPETFTTVGKRGLSDLSHIPVITGFIAKSASGEITTLGRGGSDYTAAVIGSALEAEEIEIWTDVDGIMTADPRMVEGARPLRAVSFEEASELSYFGASVLHPKTIQSAVDKRIPVRVLNTHDPDGPGTLILPEAEAERRFTAVTFKREITVVCIYSTRMLLAHGFLAKIFDVFKKYEISVDLISTSEVSVSMTLDNTDDLDKAVSELKRYGEVEIHDSRAVVCVVGARMRKTVGTAGKIFSICGDNGIPISMISVGGSRVNLSFVIEDRDLEKCITVLHEELFG